MKNLIYQYWDGEIPDGAHAGIANMKAYAERIGAEYLFEDNPRFCTEFCFPLNEFFGAHKPVYDDAFLEYDNVLYVDTDIHAVSGLDESIFDVFAEFGDVDMGICTEPFQPEYRLRRDAKWVCTANDEKLAAAFENLTDNKFPRTDAGLLKVYNAGMVIWTNKGLRRARRSLLSFREYVTICLALGLPHFYCHDQDWLHAGMVMYLDFVEMPNDWNTIVHYYRKGDNGSCLNDPRNEDTKFVHAMLTGASDFTAQQLWRIVNMPASVWQYIRPADAVWKRQY